MIGFGVFECGTTMRSHLKNRKMVRGQVRRKDLKNPDRRSGILLMKKPIMLFQVIGGIYGSILRITIQAGRRDRPFECRL